MKKRVLSAIILVAIVVACMPLIYTRVAMVCAASIICVYEYHKNLKNIDINTTLWVLIAYPVISSVLALTKCGFMTYIAWFTGAILVALFSGLIHADIRGKGAIYTLSLLAYPCFPFALIIYICTSPRWVETLLLGFLSSTFCDTFALFGGKLLGKHKLAPDISPNKTIEGSVCGSIFGILAGFVVYYISNYFGLSNIPLLPCLVASLLASTLGQIGDLAESMIKRYLGVKDFSNLIPGHGGMFDRADALLFSIPTVNLVLYLFNL